MRGPAATRGRGRLRLPPGDDLRRPAASRPWPAAGPRARSACSTSSGPTRSRPGYVTLPAHVPRPRRRRARDAPPRRPTPPPRSAVGTASAISSRSASPPAGGCAIYSGRAAEGLALLDEAMVAVGGRRGLARGVRQRLLHRDRGLPGDRRLRPRRRVDLGAAPMVHVASRAGRVHRPVLGPPRSGDAAARRVERRARGVRPGRRAVPPRQHPRRHRPGRGRARRRTPAAG